MPLPLKTLRTGEARRPGRRKSSCRHDAKWRGRGIAFVSLYHPCVCLAVEDRLFDPSVELDVSREVEPVSYMVDVAQDLRLRAVALGPMPSLLQLVGERVRVLHALDIAATPWIAFQYHVPPTPLPASKARTLRPSLRKRWRAGGVRGVVGIEGGVVSGC